MHNNNIFIKEKYLYILFTQVVIINIYFLNKKNIYNTWYLYYQNFGVYFKNKNKNMYVYIYI